MKEFTFVEETSFLTLDENIQYLKVEASTDFQHGTAYAKARIYTVNPATGAVAATTTRYDVSSASVHRVRIGEKLNPKVWFEYEKRNGYKAIVHIKDRW